MSKYANPFLLGGLAVAIVIALLLLLDRPTIETVRVVTEIDTTVVVKDETVYVYKDTSFVLPTPDTPSAVVVEPGGDTLATYTETYSDDLVDIEVRVTVKGVVRDWGIRYSLHVPVTTRDSTVYIERSTEITRVIKQWSLNIGATAIAMFSPIDSRLAMGPKFSIVTKDHKVFSYSYLSDGSHLVGVTVPLFTR